MAEQDKRKAEGQRQTPESQVEKAEAPRQAGEGRQTRLNRTADEPSFVAPGDGPFDTVDPTEHASSVAPRRDEVAAQGFGVVNAVVPIPDPSGYTQAEEARQAEADSSERTEEVTVPGPTGTPVRVRRNLDTGESQVIG